MDSLQQVDFWSKLPIELFLQILSYLPIVDLGRIGRVSKLWKQVSENNQLWVRACGCNMPQLSKAIPLKTYYVNCIRNWIHGKFMSFDLPNKNGFYHLCEIFNNETLVTGTTSDWNEEWDLKSKTSLRMYRVPTGPATDYRMTETRLLIKDSALRLWTRDRNNTENCLDDSKFDVVIMADHESRYHFNWYENLCATYTGELDEEVVFLWDLITGKKILQTKHKVETMNVPCLCRRDALQLDNQKYVFAGGGVRQYDIRTGTVVQKWNTSSPINACLEYHDNLFMVSLETRLAVYDFRSSNVLQEIQIGDKKIDMSGQLFNADEFIAQHPAPSLCHFVFGFQNSVEIDENQSLSLQQDPEVTSSQESLANDENVPSQENSSISENISSQENQTDADDNASEPDQTMPIQAPRPYVWDDVWSCRKLHFDETKCVVGRPDAVVDVFDMRSFKFLYSIVPDKWFPAPSLRDLALSKDYVAVVADQKLVVYDFS
jgi:hypothetical protein